MRQLHPELVAEASRVVHGRLLLAVRDPEFVFSYERGTPVGSHTLQVWDPAGAPLS